MPCPSSTSMRHGYLDAALGAETRLVFVLALAGSER
jgi:hypothetical protein